MPPRKTKLPATRGKAARGARQVDCLTLSDLDQVKVLADPLRIRILEELVSAERTTKQVAQRLGEKPTKLYHHVEALERVGLIRLTRTRQNRGTLEKYYLAVARQVRADSRIFAGPEAKEDAWRSVISTLLDRTADEMRGLLAHTHGHGIEEEAILSHLEIRTGPGQGRRIQTRLQKLLKSLEEGHKGRLEPGGRRYRLTLAFYPLEPDLKD